MSKRIIQLAITMAAISAVWSAQAETSVTVYGIVDSNLEYVSNNDPASDNGNKFRVRSGGLNGSRFGLKGVEDLGKGYKAIFTLEAGIDMTNGKSAYANRLFGRKAFVGLSTPWGDITLGRQFTPIFSMLVPYTPGGFSPQYEPIGSIMTGILDNSVLYRHKIGSVNVGAYYAFNTQQSQREGGLGSASSFGAVASYEPSKTSGILIGYNRINGRSNNGGTVSPSRGGKAENYIITGKIGYERWQLKAGYRYRVLDLVAPDAGPVKSHLIMVGVEYQQTEKLNLSMSYYNEKYRNAPVGWMNLRKTNLHQFSFKGIYSLSKRTNLYAVAAVSRNGPLNLGASASYRLTEGANGQFGAALGIRHVF